MAHYSDGGMSLMQGPAVSDGKRDDTTIWRYMDLPKFLSLLVTGRLWFAKAAQFKDDPWEGFCQVKTSELARSASTRDFLREGGTEPGPRSSR